ncbi:DUF4331 family protein [Allomuricauda sp. d1]|uniref:DUF4331 family protein n=1 Tax=Allomuricauda sp. d1 TaxID=3136725 RepID=UPI0031D6A020
MIFNKIKQLFLTMVVVVAIAACNNDDNEPMMDDDMMGMEDDGMMDDDMTGMDPDFSGTFAQVDFMGRPGINTTLSAGGDIKDAHNVAIPSEMVATFQADFEARLEQYHDVYAMKLGADPADVNYEANILGLDAATLTTVLAADVLEVAPDVPTTYFNPGEDNDGDDNPLTLDGDEVALTGRTLQDDIIDVSLILFFGGMEGNRFDGNNGTPQLTSDGVGLTADILTTFPYVGDPE